MIPEIIDVQPIKSISGFGFRFGHGGGSFLSPAIYKSASAKRIAMFGSVFRASIHFCSASTDAVHLLRLSSWVHWYRCFIVSGLTTHHRKKLVIACPFQCRIVMVVRVLLMHFLMKCAMWTVCVSRASLNNVKLISSQSAM